jgi:transcriptional regulator with XRE-family HTH domain
VIDAATLSGIRRWALREQLSIREIARRTGLPRNTVRRYLRDEAVEPQYPKRVNKSKLDSYAQKLAGWLKSEATKSRKQRRTLKQMHVDLVALGYEDSYSLLLGRARSTLCGVWPVHGPARQPRGSR